MASTVESIQVCPFSLPRGTRFCFQFLRDLLEWLILFSSLSYSIFFLLHSANALKQLKAIALPSQPSTTTPGVSGTGKKPPVPSKSSLPDCCICLFAVTIHQALFIAPCSHAYHYKCIRPLLETHHPAFSCPICRTFADLDEDVEVEVFESEMPSVVGAVEAALLTSVGIEGEGEMVVPPTAAGAAAAGNADADASISAALANVVSLIPTERPTTGDSSSRERNRDRDRDRDAGAETEVEAEMLPMRVSRRARRASLPLTAFSRESGGGGGGVLDFDVEMEDAPSLLPALPEGSPMQAEEDDDALNERMMRGGGGRDSSISPVPVPVPGPARSGRRSADTSEGEGDAELGLSVGVPVGVGAGDASDGSGSGSGSGGGGNGNGRSTSHHSKRKR